MSGGAASVVHVNGRQWLPDDIEVMPPGPKLCAVLAGVDRSRLADADLVVLAQARARQLAFEQAGQMADLVAIADAAGPDPFPPGGPIPANYNPDQWAESEIAAALTWSGVNAGAQLALARQVVRRLPALHAAMLAGHIDAHKARVISDQLLCLSDEQARAVVEKILPEAAGKTTGQLRHRLARLVITIDPAAARKRYREAVKHRQVWCGREEEGTLSLGGRRLPADRAAAAFDHLDTLASALLEAGDTRGLEELRADVMLDLLQGLITDLQPDRHRRSPPTATPTRLRWQDRRTGATRHRWANPSRPPAADPGKAAPRRGGGGGVRGGSRCVRLAAGRWWAGVDRAGDHADGTGRTPRRARVVGAGHRRRRPQNGPRPDPRAVAVQRHRRCRPGHLERTHPTPTHRRRRRLRQGPRSQMPISGLPATSPAMPHRPHPRTPRRRSLHPLQPRLPVRAASRAENQRHLAVVADSRRHLRLAITTRAHLRGQTRTRPGPG